MACPLSICCHRRGFNLRVRAIKLRISSLSPSLFLRISQKLIIIWIVRLVLLFLLFVWWSFGSSKRFSDYKDVKKENGRVVLRKSGERLTGILRLYYKSGAIRYKMQYKDGIRHGLSVEYAPDGSVKGKKLYRNGKPVRLDESSDSSKKSPSLNSRQRSPRTETKSQSKATILEDEPTESEPARESQPPSKSRVYTNADVVITDQGGLYLERGTKNPISGRFIIQQKNGDLLADFTMVNGIRHGISKLFHENGKLELSGEWFQGEKKGVHSAYYANGKMKSHIPFKDDLQEGLVRRYRESGTLENEYESRQGKINGLFKVFDEKGKLKEKSIFVNDKRQGESIDYFESGKVQRVSQYRNGVLHGESRIYYPSGKLDGQLNFVDGKEEGDAEFFHENGNKLFQGSYKNGKEEGRFTYYNKLGKRRKEVTFQGGIKNGPAKIYHEVGPHLSVRLNYVNDVEEGPYTSYYDDGKVASKGMFEKGKKQGVTSVYASDRSGVLVKKIEYDQDEEVRTLKITYWVDEESNEIIGISKEEELKNEQKNGLSREYDQDGDLLLEESYVSNKRDGKSLEFSSGFLMGNLLTMESYYENGQLIESNRQIFNSLLLIMEWLILIFIFLIWKFTDDTMKVIHRLKDWVAAFIKRSKQT